MRAHPCTSLAAAVLGVLAALLPASTRAAHAAPAVAPFTVGAGVGDFTPPLFGQLTDSGGHPIGDPADCIAGTPLESTYNGPRQFAFEEPYIDKMGSGHYDKGDPYIDCPVGGGAPDGRWDGNLIGGGSNTPRFYDHVADPVQARALVVSNGTSTIAVEVLDQEGVFNVYQQRIRDLVTADLAASHGHIDQVFISATHDESAPDTLGLYGVDATTSSVNPYFVDYMVRRSADAIETAYANRRPASIHLAEAIQPANLRQCWSSYPYIDNQLMPTLQAVDTSGAVIATLVSVSQHAETLGFNGDDVENPSKTQASDQRFWLTGDVPHFVRDGLERRYGGIGIAMAGAVGSVETPEVFSEVLSRVPQKHIDEGHPAGCRTLFERAGTQVPLGYNEEDVALGAAVSGAVIDAVDHRATLSVSSDLWGERADICVPVTNAIFTAGGGAGIFAERPVYVANCTVQVSPAPNGSTVGDEIKSQVAAFRIGDAEFVSLPGEVFPFTVVRGFVGPQDMPYPSFGLPTWVMPSMHAPYRFLDGLAEDMVGYIFPQGNGVGVPGEYPTTNPQASGTDRFGCGHSDDSEAASSQAGDIMANGLVAILGRHDGAPENVRQGRYVMPDGTLVRDPLGGPEVKCSADQVFHPAGPAVAVWLADGSVVVPGQWMSLSGRVQAVPDRNTRGWVDAAGTRHWLDVFADIAGQPASVAPPSVAPDAPLAILLPIVAVILIGWGAVRRRRRAD